MSARWELVSLSGKPSRWHCGCGIVQMTVQHYTEEQVQSMRYRWWVVINGLSGGSGNAGSRASAMTAARRFARRTLVQALSNVAGNNVSKWTSR